MTPQEFSAQYGIAPKKANDPLRLGSRKSKRTIIGAMLIGASLCTLIQERAQSAAGAQSLQSYVEVRQRDEGHWHLTDVIPATTIVFFTSGTSGTTASVFPNWNNGNNTVECFGGGGNAGLGANCCSGATGGGGGGYAAKSNVTLGATFSYAIGAANGTTQFASSAVVATGGTSPGMSFAGGAGGAGTVGTTLYTGGAGGPGDNDGNSGGAGGGGCAGKHGNGIAGGDPTGGVSAPGGAGDAGYGGAGGAGATAGGAGNEYTSTGGAHAGPGGGGGGLDYGPAGSPGAGGLYGGGGGGWGGYGFAGGAGAQGLIVVTYVPLGPTVSSVTPSLGPVIGGTAVAIAGANFTGATSVLFGAVAGTALTVNSISSISITSPAHAVGIVDVTVVSPAGTSATGSADKFTYTAGTALTMFNMPMLGM